jgi:hypothetical protein
MDSFDSAWGVVKDLDHIVRVSSVKDFMMEGERMK